ncbi:vanadium-dependent haloperoxidase [Flagellimonas sp. S174]|uniref:vanadium-dependent haloperoxidase n=1 Tax=Flagellimonas sp. S174 TaxID=3410790 RepID=UPI003BF4C37A
MTPSTKIPTTLFLSVFCTIVMLIAPLGGFGQLKPSTFSAFKFELKERFSPVNETLLRDEISEIIAVQQEMEEEDIWSVRYWNGSYPSYRWHQLLMQVSRNDKGYKNGGRVAIMHLTIYDALVEVWKHKKVHFQKAAYQYDSKIKKLVQDLDSSTFICEWSAAAGAAHRIIGYYFPKQKELLDSSLIAFKSTRLATGLQFPSDIEKGLEIGQKIADKYIEYAKGDRTNLRWEGSVPKVDSLWSGNPGPWDPMKRQWKPLTLVQSNQFRPGPPPEDWSSDIEELRQFNAEHQTSEIAWRWKSEPIWDRLIERKILEYDLNPLEAAFANAVFHTARFDGIIAAWDGKYHYWGIRPFQYDPSFQPILIDTPNFPGYPAGHTTVAGSIAKVLSFLFPKDEPLFYELAKECSESRFEGGVHFRTDNEVGLEVGYKVGQWVIKCFTE